MKKNRRPFLKQKPILYIDENVPATVVDHFRKGSRWKKKVKVLSAIEAGNKGMSDEFHYGYCARKGYTLVTSDEDFNEDTAFPFGNGTMHGVVIIKEAKGNPENMQRVLANLLHFVETTPYPKLFLTESKLTVSGEGCVMRGRDVKTKEVKSYHIVAGRAKIGDVWKFFSY